MGMMGGLIAKDNSLESVTVSHEINYAIIYITDLTELLIKPV
jgi:hypothetical protein